MKLKTYKDSKEFPLANYERVASTGDFFYMIKGYDAGDEVEADPDEMQALFNAVVQDYVISLNSKNFDIVQHGKIAMCKMELLKFAAIREVLTLQQKAAALGGTVNQAMIAELLAGIKIQRSDDLQTQTDIIDRKLEKLKNDIAEAERKIEKAEPDGEPSDINDMITNVEVILERGIDMQKTSLYRFGVLQDYAKKKVEQYSKRK